MLLRRSLQSCGTQNRHAARQRGAVFIPSASGTDPTPPALTLFDLLFGYCRIPCQERMHSARSGAGVPHVPMMYVSDRRNCSVWFRCATHPLALIEFITALTVSGSVDPVNRVPHDGSKSIPAVSSGKKKSRFIGPFPLARVGRGGGRSAVRPAPQGDVFTLLPRLQAQGRFGKVRRQPLR